MSNTIISLIIFIQVLFFGFAPDLNRIKYSYPPLDIYSKLRRRRQQHHFNDLSSKSTGSVQTSWAYIVFAWHILFKNNFKTHSNFDSPRSMTSEVDGWMGVSATEEGVYQKQKKIHSHWTHLWSGLITTMTTAWYRRNHSFNVEGVSKERALHSPIVKVALSERWVIYHGKVAFHIKTGVFSGA